MSLTLTLWKHTIARCSAAIGRDPSDGEAFYHRGLARHYMGQAKEAMIDYDQAAALGYRTPHVLHNMALLHFHRGEFSRAIDVWTQVLAGDFHAGLVYYCRGTAYLQLRNIPAAVLDLSFAIQTAPCWAEALLNRGLAHKKLGRLDKAAIDYSAAIQAKPGYAAAYTNRAIIRMAQGDREGSLADVKQSLVLGGTVPRALILALAGRG